jgi:hypothetical protein
MMEPNHLANVIEHLKVRYADRQDMMDVLAVINQLDIIFDALTVEHRLIRETNMRFDERLNKLERNYNPDARGA